MSPLPPIPPQVVAGAVNLAKKGVVTILGPALLKEAKKYWKEDHGSKVKEGAYKNCSIDMFADKTCILVDPEDGEIVLLIAENIMNCRFIKEKFRVKRGKTYYYYEITFVDGKESYVRMSKKYRDAMLEYT